MKYIVMAVEYDDEENYKNIRAKFRNLYKKNGINIKTYREFGNNKQIKEEKLFSFKTIDGHRIFQYSEIIYMRKELRKVYIYTTKGNFIFYGKMKDVVEKLDMRYFITPHKSFIINKNKIIATDKSNIYVRDCCELIPISKRNKHNVIKMLKEIGV